MPVTQLPRSDVSIGRVYGKLSRDQMDYIRRREAQERAAAKQASTLAARRAHQELAQLYARLATH